MQRHFHGHDVYVLVLILNLTGGAEKEGKERRGPKSLSDLRI